MQALRHFLLCPIIHESEGIDMAIKVVSEAKEETLTQRLIDHLIGDVDATPKVIFYTLHLGLIARSCMGQDCSIRWSLYVCIQYFHKQGWSQCICVSSHFHS